MRCAVRPRGNAGEAVASANEEVTGEGDRKGAGAVCRPTIEKKLATSRVENGAGKGSTTSDTSQTAHNRDSIDTQARARPRPPLLPARGARKWLAFSSLARCESAGEAPTMTT
jgi:hypothetical protein